MAAGGVSRPCQGALDDSQGARVDVWSGWKRAGGLRTGSGRYSSRSVGCAPNFGLWTMGSPRLSGEEV
jgi:hypothetical protein